VILKWLLLRLYVKVEMISQRNEHQSSVRIEYGLSACLTAKIDIIVAELFGLVANQEGIQSYKMI
jgi:hypothetical protein